MESIAVGRVVPLYSRALELLRYRAILVTLGLIIALSLGLRLYGIDWDQGGLFHPDERAIFMKVDQLALPSPQNLGDFFNVDESPVNPRWFPYGSFPLYLLKFGTNPFSILGDNLDVFEMRFLGRALSAIFDTATVLMVFLLGSRLYGKRVGLLAAAFVGLAVIHIQNSHFYTTDVILAFFVVLTLFFAVRVMEKGDRKNLVLMGLFMGLALATKASAAPLLLAVALAPALHHFAGEDQTISLNADSYSTERFKRTAKDIFIALAPMIMIFFIVQPYAFLDWGRFFGDVGEQSDMVRRILDYPYTRQYIDTTPYLYHIRQLTVWGLGPLLGVVAWGGFLFTFIVGVARRHRRDLLLLSWVVPYFLIVGSFDVKFLRYLLPLTPILAIMGARMLFSAVDWVKGKGFTRLSYRWVYAAIALVLLSSFLYSLAYANIYSTPHPAQRLSQWIRGNVPQGSVILQEHWEEPLRKLGGYTVEKLNLYDPDNEAKVDHIVGRLKEGDYIAFYSNRLYATIPRLPQRYPITSRYYQLLFSGRLGFELVHFETSYPSLLGLTLVDETFGRGGLPTPKPLDSFEPSTVSLNWGVADESFTVYDHPKSMIFKKVRELDESELRALLQGESVKRGGLLAAPLPQEGVPLYSEEDARAQQEGGTFSDIFDRNGLTNRFPAITWLLLVEIISLISLPLGFFLFRRLPDKGYLLTKVLGLLLVAYLVWLAASLKWLTFSRGTIVVAMVIVAAVSAFLFLRYRDEMTDFMRPHWRLILFSEALFLTAFVFFYGLRLWNPDLWSPDLVQPISRGGEKPMDFAYLNAVIKSTYMPPYDPWFAGAPLNYYYFGQFNVATLAKLSGVIPSVAYNLAVPLLYALTFGAAFSIVYNLAAATKRARNSVTSVSWVRIQSPVLAGLAGALFVSTLANIDGLVQLVQGIWRALVRDLPFGQFDFWRSSRMIDIDPSGNEITEFPFFSFLFADLHAHVIAIPFALLAIGLALSLVLSAKRGLGSPRHWIIIAALALTVGSLRMINTWDFPTYILFSIVAVAIAQFVARKKLDSGFWGWAALKGGALFGLSALLILPFLLNYRNFINFPWVDLSDFTTPLHQYLAIHSIFIFGVLAFLLYRLWPHMKGLRVFQRETNLGFLGGGGYLLAAQNLTNIKLLYFGFSGAVILTLLLLGLTTVAFLAFILLLLGPLVVQEMTAK